MAQFQTVILSTLRNRFEINDLQGAYQQNVWIMALAIIPYIERHAMPLPGDEEPPTHTMRLVLRTTDEAGTNVYVDGTDIYIRIDSATKTAEFVWEDLWAEGPPIFHGGTVPDALRWVHELAEPFYVQLKDPFLTPERQIALNGHDEDYTEPA
ncbi:hypothetical protein [Paenibacillus pasadenensis]|uniref:hypothetical protein n=1 Tax=Paenibacillus pasadenensis TaxID=217090 RepID=UPI000C7D33A2|nr:hypothetical protein [Paenibacillus pasadenensis]